MCLAIGNVLQKECLFKSILQIAHFINFKVYPISYRSFSFIFKNLKLQTFISRSNNLFKEPSVDSLRIPQLSGAFSFFQEVILLAFMIVFQLIARIICPFRDVGENFDSKLFRLNDYFEYWVFLVV